MAHELLSLQFARHILAHSWIYEEAHRTPPIENEDLRTFVSLPLSTI